MTSTASWQLQEALYAALTSDTGLTTLLGGAKVYDLAPRSAKLPYITIGMTQERDWSTSSEEGGEHTITLHIWTENQGRKQTAQIMATVQEALKTTTLSLADHHLINLTYEFSEIRRDPDGEVLHGLIRYRAITEPKTTP